MEQRSTLGGKVCLRCGEENSQIREAMGCRSSTGQGLPHWMTSREGITLGMKRSVPSPCCFSLPPPTSPTPGKNPSQEIEGVAFSSLASIRIENDASNEETFLLGPPLTKKYLLGERELSYFNYSKYAKGILRGIYRLLLTICILRLLLRQIFCFKMNV